MYHDVRDPNATRFPRRYQGTSFLTPAQLEGQLDYIARHYNVVRMAQVVEASRGHARLPERAAVLTFDDGLRDHFTEVFPRLSARRWPALFLVPTLPVRDRKMIPSHKIQLILAASPDERTLVQALFDELEALRRGGAGLPGNSELWARYSISRWGARNTWSPEMVFVTRLFRESPEPAIRTDLLDRMMERVARVTETEAAWDLYMTPEQVRCLFDAGFEV